MKQAIVAFHQDLDGDWIAELACGHRQHVRHNPPLTNRPWIRTPAGRSEFIGVLLECKWCDEEAKKEAGGYT